LKEEGHPFCLINQHFEEEAFHEVDADHVEGSWQAVRHLLDQGFTRIAFLNGPESYSNSRDRLTGYARALEESNLPLDDSLLFEGNFSRKSGVMAAKEMLPLLNEIDAIVAANDRMAIGLQQGLQALGIPRDHIPAIVGYDDSDAAELTTPALSSVRVPFYELGEIAVAKVLELLGNSLSEISSSSQVIQIKLPTELVIRASSIIMNPKEE
jgi:LacI family transcriptional regulator